MSDEVREALAVYARRIMQLEKGYDELRTVCNRVTAERDALRAELARVSEQLEIALADLKQCQDMWAAQTKTALAGTGEGEK